MTDLNLSKVTLTDVANITDLDYKVSPIATDAAGNQEETEWQNTNAGQYLAYY